MYGYFFTYQDALPENSGFPLFWRCSFYMDCRHCHKYFPPVQSISASCQKQNACKMLNAFVLLALCCTFTQDAILTVTGHMNARMLPFHFCDLATFFLPVFANAHSAHRSLWLTGRNCTVPFYAWRRSRNFISGVECISAFSLYDNPRFYISRSDHPLSMAAFCQRKRSSQNQTHLAAGTFPLLHCATRLSL